MFLLSCLDAILNQTYCDFEIIIIDDGSTDDTKFKVVGLDKRIYYHRLDKTGNPSILRNFGIEQSKGDLVAFCDDDDIWHPEKLELQLNYINDFNIVCTNADLVDSRGENMNVKYCTDFEDDTKLSINHLFIRNYIITSTVLLEKKILSKNPFDIFRTKSMAEDFDLWLKLSLSNSIYFVNKSLIKYRIHTSAIHPGENYFLLYANAIDIINKYKKMVPRNVRKYAIWGSIKLRLSYIKMSISKRKYLVVLGEMVKIVPNLFKIGFMRLLLKKILYPRYNLLRNLEKGL